MSLLSNNLSHHSQLSFYQTYDAWFTETHTKTAKTTRIKDIKGIQRLSTCFQETAETAFLPFLLFSVFSNPFCEALEMKHAIHGGKVHCVPTEGKCLEKFGKGINCIPRSWNARLGQNSPAHSWRTC